MRQLAGLVAGGLALATGIAAGLTATPLVAETGASSAASASSVRNLADFDFVTAKVAANYAGWESKTAGARRAELAALTARLRAAVVAGDEAAFREAMGQWIGWFDDGHLQLQWAAGDAAPAWRAPVRRLTEAAARARLAALGAARHPLEGLWTIDDRYRLVVLRGDPAATRFEAVVLATGAPGWRAGEVKALFTPRAGGGFAVRYGAGDRTEQDVVAQLRSRDEVLDLGEFGIWRRVLDDPAQAATAPRRWPGDDFALTPIAQDTLYLRLPSFGDGHADTVRQLIAAHAEALSRTPQLIIDLRGNGGGSDFVYGPLLPWLATRPIWRLGVEIRASADNARLRAEAAGRLAAVSPDAARVLLAESARMAQVPEGTFIRREPPVEVVRFDRVRPAPARVAVLLDRAGSSAENFLMDVRQSRKVVLMGQENSAGVIDHGEMMALAAPSGRFALAWPTTRSLRLPNDPVDPAGIAPDVRIPAEIDDPVAWAADHLRRQAR